MKQSKIFNIFLLLVIVFYSCNKSEKVLPVRDCSNETPFFISSAFNNYDSDNREQGKKLTIVVNTELYGLISSYISRYTNDLYNEGYLADVYSSSGGNPEDLRNFLKTQFDAGMEGCLLVGDLPVPLYFTSYCPSHEPSSEVFPCDLFYMDLDGIFEDQDGDCVYDAHTGSIEPDIWMGRLTASQLTYNDSNEVSLMRNYFDKNHDYRHGRKSLAERALVFVNLDHEDFYSSVSLAYENIVNIQGMENTCRDEYLEQLQDEYELIQVCSHGTTMRHDFLRADESHCSVNFSDIVDSDPKTFFAIIYGCTTCKYTVNNNLGNWYVFTPTYGLAALGSAKSGSQLQYWDFYRSFGQGKTIGESLKDWFAAQMEDGFSDQERCCFGGMTLLGDPTLKKRSFMIRDR